MSFRQILSGLSTFTLVAGIAAAGPFGLSFGTPLKTLKVTAPMGFMSLVSVPAPDAEFNMYGVYSSPKYGVCRITATGRAYDSIPETRKAFKKMLTALNKTYGAPSNAFNPAKPGANKKDNFVPFPLNMDTIQSAHWSEPKHAGKTGAITLAAQHLSATASHLTLNFYGADYAACKATPTERTEIHHKKRTN